MSPRRCLARGPGSPPSPARARGAWSCATRQADPVRDLTALREQYQREGLRRSDLADTPTAQFETWFDQWLATDPYDAAAMVVATVDAAGHPTARFVLLRNVDERGFVFFTNYESAKASDLEA